MSIIDCTCRGINPECEKCDGRGYYEADELNKTRVIHFWKKTQSEKDEIPEKKIQFDEILEKLPKNKIRGLKYHLIKAIDIKSEVQESIIKSTPWKRTSTSKILNKIEYLNSLEMEKRNLKAKLNKLIKQAELLNVPLREIKYCCYLSSMEIEIWSDIVLLNEMRLKLSQHSEKLK